MGEMDINAALGESYEYGGRAPLLPGSYYPMTLTVLSTGTSDPKIVTDDAGNETEGGNTPFVELCATVSAGPFAGNEVTRKAYITTGKTGGAFGRWLGACKAITRQTAQTAVVCAKFGVALPNPASVRPEGKETSEQAFRKAIRLALADGFYAMDAGTRLAFVAAMLNIVAWDGKQVIVKLGLEERAGKDQNGVARMYSNNNFDGFIPLDDEKHGLAWVRSIEFPKQEATKALMESQAAGA